MAVRRRLDLLPKRQPIARPASNGMPNETWKPSLVDKVTIKLFSSLLSMVQRPTENTERDRDPLALAIKEFETDCMASSARLQVVSRLLVMRDMKDHP